ncbi:hypothetical protein [Romboutsia sp. 1001713B170207_170306_H8]|uniref:hypothetical protein n=2 Tax=unclassified Romboutsia TaxID=2626894 RepID=UPI000821B9D4|nr:hypothetical protein [Romboutsia sp. 1001713B170207_170306_H8]SCH77112.1 Uncharacterised protein [uncultured Clostridium sp.]
MKNNKAIFSIVIIIAFLIGGYIFIRPSKETVKQNNVNNKVEEDNGVNNNKTIAFLRAIQGVKIESLELVDNPVGFNGSFLAPKNSIKNGVDYFLEESKNDKIDKVQVDIGSGYIKINVDYKVSNTITTPIELKIIPSINNHKDLLLKITEVKFLDLKIADWIINMGVNKFLNDWFTNESDLIVKFDDSNVIIDKSNFKEFTLNNISIDSQALKIDMFINMENMKGFQN